MARPAFIWSPAYEVDIGRHVFPTQKFRLLKEALIKRGLVASGEIELATMASDDELLAVLQPAYLAALRTYRHTAATQRSELPITRAIVEGMVTTAGGSILCAKRAVERGFACHLGGGYHHGFADHAEGFCYINDVAVAAAVTLQRGLARHITIVDTDVHQGNGTARIFRDSNAVYTFSIHQEELYPTAKETSDLDIGLPRDCGGEVYLAELARGLDIAIARQHPDLVIHVAGVDPFEEDQLGGLRLTREEMAQRDHFVVEAAARRGIPFMTVVAGGYSRDVAETVALHVQTIEAVLEFAGN